MGSTYGSVTQIIKRVHLSTSHHYCKLFPCGSSLFLTLFITSQCSRSQGGLLTACSQPRHETRFVPVDRTGFNT